MDRTGMTRAWIALACAYLCGCDRPPVITPIAPVPKWVGGEFVKSPLTEQRGQVISYICFKNADRCIYQVRWADRPKRAKWMGELELSPT